MSIYVNNLNPTADLIAIAPLGTGLNIYSYLGGTNGVGATLTAGQNNVSLTVDGVSVSVGMIILVNGETTSYYNGLYVCTQIAASGVPCVLTRHVNMNSAPQFNYSIVAITQGNTNANTLWMFQYVSGFVVNSSNVVFSSLGVAGMNKTIQQLTASGSNLPWNINLGYNAYYKPAAGSSVTITFSNLPTSNIGVYGTLVVTQPASGTAATLYVSTTPSSIVVGGGTPSATPGLLQLSTVNSAVDIVSFYYDGSTMYWTYAPNFKT